MRINLTALLERVVDQVRGNDEQEALQDFIDRTTGFDQLVEVDEGDTEIFLSDGKDEKGTDR